MNTRKEDFFRGFRANEGIAMIFNTCLPQSMPCRVGMLFMVHLCRLDSQHCLASRAYSKRRTTLALTFHFFNSYKKKCIICTLLSATM